MALPASEVVLGTAERIKMTIAIVLTGFEVIDVLF